jgi:hypothetical protein
MKFHQHDTLHIALLRHCITFPVGLSTGLPFFGSGAPDLEVEEGKFSLLDSEDDPNAPIGENRTLVCN